MSLKSFIEAAPESHFPLENLPFGIFRPRDGSARAGVAIGDQVVDLSVLENNGHLADALPHTQRYFDRDSLNAFLTLGRPIWRKVRAKLQELLAAETATLRDDAKLRARVFHAQREVIMQLPVKIGDYTDFYSSYHHAHNV